MPDFRNFVKRGGSRAGSGLTVQEFLVPCHLDGFEFAFVGGRWIAGKAGELGDPLVHVREAGRERIGVRKFVGQADGDVFDLVPTECWRHAWLLAKSEIDGSGMVTGRRAQAEA